MLISRGHVCCVFEDFHDSILAMHGFIVHCQIMFKFNLKFNFEFKIFKAD